MDCAVFKTPVSKLVTFFRKSRDNWKAKCLEAKRRNKLLANQVRAVEKSRGHWKRLAKEAQQKHRQLEREVAVLKNAAGACRS